MRAPWPWHDEWTEEHLADSQLSRVTQVTHTGPDSSTDPIRRPLTPKGWIREANCSATSKWAGSKAKSDRWHVNAKTVRSPFLLEQEFTQKKAVRGFWKIEKSMASHCTSHGSAFLWHRADCCVASQGKTMTSDSKFGRFLHTCLMQLGGKTSGHTTDPNSHQQLRMFPVFLSLQRITTHLCRLSQPSAF